jgi:hypothetical protein
MWGNVITEELRIPLPANTSMTPRGSLLLWALSLCSFLNMRDQIAWLFTVTTYLHLVSSLRMSGAVPPLHHCYRGAPRGMLYSTTCVITALNLFAATCLDNTLEDKAFCGLSCPIFVRASSLHSLVQLRNIWTLQCERIEVRMGWISAKRCYLFRVFSSPRRLIISLGLRFVNPVTDRNVGRRSP